jgi:hypothetical protein
MKKKQESEGENIGSDLEQMIAMLEKSEIDYSEEDGSIDEDEEQFTIVDVNESVRMIFDDEGDLMEINPIPN